MKRITIVLLAMMAVLTGCDLVMSDGTLFGTIEEENAAGIANGFAGGNGTAESPYLISSAEQFRIIGTEDFQNELLKGENDDLHFRLTADIDLSDQEGYVAEVFSGTLDGDGHTIYGSNDMPYIFHYFFEDTAFRGISPSSLLMRKSPGYSDLHQYAYLRHSPELTEEMDQAPKRVLHTYMIRNL